MLVVRTAVGRGPREEGGEGGSQGAQNDMDLGLMNKGTSEGRAGGMPYAEARLHPISSRYVISLPAVLIHWRAQPGTPHPPDLNQTDQQPVHPATSIQATRPSSPHPPTHPPGQPTHRTNQLDYPTTRDGDDIVPSWWTWLQPHPDAQPPTQCNQPTNKPS